MEQGFIQESQIVLREIPLHYLTALNSLNLLINMNPHAHREREIPAEIVVVYWCDLNSIPPPSLSKNFFIFTSHFYITDAMNKKIQLKTLPKLQFIYFTTLLMAIGTKQTRTSQSAGSFPGVVQSQLRTQQRFRFTSGWSAQVSKWPWILHSSRKKTRLFLYSARGIQDVSVSKRRPSRKAVLL